MNSDALLDRARLLLQQDRYEQASVVLKELLSQDPEVGEAHSLLALCMLEDRDHWHEATREAERGIHLEPDAGFAHYVRAAVLGKRNQFADASISILEALRLEPYQSHFHALHASILLQERKWAQALDAATQGLQFDPEDTACANMRSLALERLGRTNDSLEQADAAVARNPDSGQAHAMRGWALLQKGDYRGSQISFREALRLEPTDEFARQGMIQALNSNNFVFRAVFKFYSLMGRLATGAQWMLIVGLFVGMRALRSLADTYPQLQPFVTPISACYLIFCLLSWILNPLFNTFLRFHPFGKYLLSNKQKWASNLIAGLIVIAVIVAGIQAARGDFASAIVAGLIPLFLMLPISLAFDVDRGWPQVVSILCAIAKTLLALLSLLLLVLDGPWQSPYLLFMLGTLILSFVGNMLKSVTVKY